MILKKLEIQGFKSSAERTEVSFSPGVIAVVGPNGSGESEFFINKTACRLKDIYELFLDTGVGRGAYSIVSQGEIDAMLSANPEDRRAFLLQEAVLLLNPLNQVQGQGQDTPRGALETRR